MSSDPFVKYFHELKKIQDKRESIVWNLTILEQHLEDSHDSRACTTLLEMSRDLEEVVQITKRNKAIPKIPEVAEELKKINEFAQHLERIIRGKSWFSICREFEPKSSLDNITDLKNILKRSSRKPGRKQKVEERLVDDEDFK